MKIPFLKKKNAQKSPKPLRAGNVYGVRASAFFLEYPNKEKDQVFDKVLEEVNNEQREIVEEFGKTTV